MKFTIKDLNNQFPDDSTCLTYIFNYRFGKGYKCPDCGKASWSKITGRKAWACAWCGYQVHPLAGTIFHKSDTPLTYWFFAIYKFANARNGVAAKELERDLGVTYKTAWRMAKQIRKLFEMDEFKLGGNVEIDETFMEKIKDPRTRKGIKAFGMVQRGGSAKAIAIHNAKLVNTIPLIESEVEKGSNVMTDRSMLYKGNLPEYNHNAVNHSAGEWAFGQIHTNTVEGFFSQIKRSIDGTYHRISPKYLQSYLDEFSWRLTHARSQIPLFLLMLQRLCRPQLGEVA